MSHRNDLIPSDYVAVTPLDATVVNFIGLLVTVAGDVVWKSQPDSTAVTFASAPAGTYIYGQICHVMTATAATVLGLKA